MIKVMIIITDMMDILLVMKSNRTSIEAGISLWVVNEIKGIVIQIRMRRKRGRIVLLRMILFLGRNQLQLKNRKLAHLS